MSGQRLTLKDIFDFIESIQKTESIEDVPVYYSTPSEESEDEKTGIVFGVWLGFDKESSPYVTFEVEKFSDTGED